MSKNVKRPIPKKNYYLLALLVVVTLLLLYFCVNWYQKYQDSKLSQPEIATVISEVKKEELSNYLMDNPNIVIYFTISEDEKVRTFEKDLKKYILDHDLQEQIVYVNTSAIKEDSFYSNFVDDYFASDLKKKNLELEHIPNMVFVKDGKVRDILIKYESEIHLDDVKRFLTQNEVVEND